MRANDTADRQAPDIARDADSRIGAYVAELRAGAGMTQAELASQMRAQGWKWSQQSCWAIEKGRQTLRLQEAADLAHVLGVEVWWLLSYADSEAPGVRDRLRQMHAASSAITAAVRAYESIRHELCLEIDRPHRPLPDPWRGDIISAAGTTALDIAKGGMVIDAEDFRTRPATATGAVADIYFSTWERYGREHPEA